MEEEPKKILLLVEDDPLMLRMYERVFNLEGIGVELAVNGEEAISKLEKMDPKPNVIVLDIMMPKINGFEVLRYVKKHPDLNGIPVVILTNLARRDDAEKALSLGAIMYLVKSQYDAKTVIEKIKEVLGSYSDTDVSEDRVPEVKATIKDLPGSFERSGLAEKKATEDVKKETH